MSHTCMSDIQRSLRASNPSCHTYERVIIHVTHVYEWSRVESSRTYDWVILQVWMSHVIHMHESCHTCVWVKSSWIKSAFLDGYCSTVQGLLDWIEVDLGFTKLLFIQTDLFCVWVKSSWIMSDIWVSHLACMNESCHTYVWVMSHAWISHVAQI